MPPTTTTLARPFLAPSGAAPADALLATFPMDTIPLDPSRPLPPSSEEEEEGPEGGCSNPAQGNSEPSQNHPEQHGL